MFVSLVSVVYCTACVLFGLFVTLYLYFTRNFNFWKKRGIPYAKPLPFVGNLKEAAFQTLDIGQNLKLIYDDHKSKPYIGFFSFDQPTLLFNDPDVIKTILSKDAQHFVNRTQAADDSADPLTARAIFVLKNQKWKSVRSAMTPIFTTGKMKKMFYLVERCSEQLTQYLDMQAVDGAPVNVKDVMAKYTTDVITSCAFGIDSNSLTDPNAEFSAYTRRFVEFTFLKSFATLAISFAPALQKILKLKILDDDIVAFLRKTVWSTVQHREKYNVDRKDFLDNMMVLRKKAQESKNTDDIVMDGDHLVAQSYAFLLAGFETSASTLTFALYEIALHPDMQERLRKEIIQTLEKYSQEISYDSLMDMPYLEMVVSETLRKYPIVPFLDRACDRDWKFPDSEHSDCILPRGIATYIPIYAIHRDPQYYPNPEVFDPERFTQENIRKRHPCTYIPFGGGPRICLGRRFALMEIKSGLVHILSRYEVTPCKNTPIPMKLHPKPFLIQSLKDIPLIFKKIPAMN